MKRMMGLLLAVVMLCGLSFSAGAAERPASLSSLSAVLYEPQSGRVLYAKDADTRRPMASTTKLMTALVAVEYLDISDTVTVPETAVLVEGTAMGLRGGDEVAVRDLLTGLLLSSGNDAANTLALLTSGSLPAFATLMNAKAAELGMSRSVFVTPSGLDEGDHGSTARDMALLGAAVLKQPLLAELCATKEATVYINGNPITVSNHNRLLRLYDDAVGLKTGFTKKSGRCLVSAATRDGVTLVVASLNGGDYWNDHMALYEYGFSLVEAVVPPTPSLPTVAVCGGESDSVSLTAPTPEAVVLQNGEAARVTYEWELPRFVWAPVQAGDTLGALRYKVDDRVLAQVPLTASTSVAQRAAVPFREHWRRRIEQLFDVVLG